MIVKQSSEPPRNGPLESSVLDGSLSKVFCQSKKLHMKVCEPGSVTALVFWFDMGLSPGVSTSTVDPEMNWRQAAYMLYGGRVEKGQEVVVEAKLEKSYLHFSLV